MDIIEKSNRVKKQWILWGRIFLGLFIFLFLNRINDMFEYPAIIHPISVLTYFSYIISFYIWYGSAKYCACTKDGHKFILVYTLYYLITIFYNIGIVYWLINGISMTALTWFGVKQLIFGACLTICAIASVITSFRLFLVNREKKALATITESATVSDNN